MYFLPALDLLLHIINTNSAYRHQLNTQALDIELTDLCSQLPTRRSKYSTYSFSQDIILENVIGSCHQLYTFYYNGSLPPDILYTYKNNWHRLTTTSFLLTTGIGSQPPGLYLQLASAHSHQLYTCNWHRLTATSFILATGIGSQPPALYFQLASSHSHQLYTYNWQRLTATSFILTTGNGSQPPALYLQLALDTATSYLLETGISLQPSANYLIKPSAHSH